MSETRKEAKQCLARCREFRCHFSAPHEGMHQMTFKMHDRKRKTWGLVTASWPNLPPRRKRGPRT